MTLKDYLRSWNGLQATNKVLSAALVGTTLALVLVAWQLSRREQLVVLVPPELDQRALIGRSQADQGYIEAWAVLIAHYLGNVQPQNAEFLRGRLGPLLDPAIYAQVIDALEKQIDQIRRDRVVLRFEARRVVYERATGKAFVSGYSVIESLAGGREQSPRTYELTIQINNYRPLISHLTTYAGEPRTQEVLEREPKLSATENRG
jgi:conjugal transfer pilus assembly protein TraE